VSRAYSLIELLVALTLALLLCGAGMPTLLAARDDIRADGAADFLVSEFCQARMEALRRNANVAVRFESGSDDYWLAFYVDGNANGVRSADITSGADALLRPRERLDLQFPGVRFGFDDEATDIDGTSSAENPSPIRFGTSRMLSFSPTGTSSSGTVYLIGRGRRQLAVRVLGGSGRIRQLLFNFGTRGWNSR
jgi:type II secretory pathway pseudopilin PulG